jgi:uncharacterized protein
MRNAYPIIVSLILLAGPGCEKSPTGASNPGPTTSVTSVASVPTPSTPAAPHYYRDLPLTNLPTVKLWVGPAELKPQVSLTMAEVATGLMHRSGIGMEESMLFVFGEPQPRSFYMKNVTFDIAAAYIDEEGVIDQIVILKKMDETPVPSKSTRIQYVLETAPDWFIRHGIREGMLIRGENMSLHDIFAGHARVR